MKIVVLTGAGISAESGLKTFRDSDGLWEGYHIHDVATPEAWERNPGLVQEFYNERRRQVLAAQPNQAHQILAELEANFDIEIITQNIDDLHERAGSTKVTHLHGIITKSQSDRKSNLTYSIEGSDINMGELCELGSQLRPHVVWFGEAVPMIEVAADICQQADVFVLIGTSLAVYPAAGLIDFIPKGVTKYIIDPRTPDVKRYQNVIAIEKNAVQGVAELKHMLLNAN
ncbi:MULTISPECIES: SIR2 family NAD-dependent protein deacylase [Pedobacter]|uniref:protein acetyllysine N-acetyltransferase n=1 Tax=Pedobacter agri TaxID=454586 RepID=A0A9X3DDZ6_9SPHI|nr:MULTISPECIES: Sir2 family NAD-dependent protein deacetylase [Pedobacter]AZI27153.1 NAD-dependent deacylase [Pedobacter sp. G11]MCX3265396.1 NAD-dependent deacylase [Pedobacter agri]